MNPPGESLSDQGYTARVVPQHREQIIPRPAAVDRNGQASLARQCEPAGDKAGLVLQGVERSTRFVNV